MIKPCKKILCELSVISLIFVYIMNHIMKNSFTAVAGVALDISKVRFQNYTGNMTIKDIINSFASQPITFS